MAFILLYNSKHKNVVKGFAMRRLGSCVLAVCASMLFSLVVNPGVASAFSAYGAGTSVNPYRIATCAQLQEIDDDKAGYYVLVSNIDCNGLTFVHLANTDAFTGTLDGQNHSIANISIDNNALFKYTNGATIKNIKLASGSVGDPGIASYVVWPTDTTMSNLHSSLTINGGSTNNSTAGIAAYLYGTTSVSYSSYSGTLNGATVGGYKGGLVGQMWDSTVLVTDSFVDGTLNFSGAYNGGVAGGPFSGTIRRVYSSAIINLNSSSYSGGLSGRTQVPVEDSFAASTISNPGTGSGGFVGNDNGGTYTNDFYDKYLSGNLDCGNGSGSCTIANNANAAPNYFKNNTTNGPLSTWNFSTIWQTTTGYPTLRNLSTFADPTVPNSGDANGDSTLDSYQARVASVQNASNIWSTVEVPSNTNCTITSPEAVDANSLTVDTGLIQQLSTMTGFDAYCPTSGATVPVTIIYDKQYDTSKSVLRHYNPTTGRYSTVSGAVFGTRTVGGVEKTTVTYNVTDGGSLDTDGVANGVIKDPVGFSIAPTAPVTGTGSASKPFTMYLFGLLSLAAIATGLTILRFRQSN